MKHNDRMKHKKEIKESESLPLSPVSSQKDEGPNKPLLTAAELMRRSIIRKEKIDEGEVQHHDVDKQKQNLINDDIDDEIKRLEAELAEDSSDSDESDNDTSSDDDDDDDESNDSDRHSNKKTKSKITFGETTILNQDEIMSTANRRKGDEVTKESVIFSQSQCADESISPLPSTSLPTCKSKKLKIDYDQEDVSIRGNDTKKQKKRKRSSNNKEDNKQNNQISDGLRGAVLEVLQGYVPRSSERIPFYCRVCSHTSSNEEEFIAHKKTEFHKTAVQVEKKKTYCKLCRKQLTSLVQMEEHLQSRPHRDKLDFVKARQRGDFRNNNGDQDSGRHHQSGRGRGRGGSGRGYGRKHEQRNGHRQWC